MKTSATWNTKYAYNLAYEQLTVLCFVYKSFTNNITRIQILKTKITLNPIEGGRISNRDLVLTPHP